MRSIFLRALVILMACTAPTQAQYLLRQSTASQEMLIGPFLDDTDGKTAETGLTIANTDIKIWKAGATTEADKNSGGATHVAAGRYYIVLDATDTDTLGSLEINVHVAGALPIQKRCTVLTANVFDSLVAGSAKLPATIAAGDIATGAITADAIATDAIGAAEIAAGAIGAAEVADGTIDAATFVTSAIDANSIATDAITNLELATSAVNEIVVAASIPSAGTIADAVWDETSTGHLDAGKAYATMAVLNKLDLALELDGAVYRLTSNAVEQVRVALGMAANDLDAQLLEIRSKTTNLPANPAAVGSAMTLANDSITAAVIAADAIGASEIAAGAIVAGTEATGFSTLTVGDVWNAATATYGTAGSYGLAIESLSAAGNPWSELLPGAFGAGTAGYLLGHINNNLGPGADNVTITITSGGVPVPACNVWITSDQAGTTVIAGTLRTNAAGQVTFLLNDGSTYYLWAEKSGFKHKRGARFVAEAD